MVNANIFDRLLHFKLTVTIFHLIFSEYNLYLLTNSGTYPQPKYSNIFEFVTLELKMIKYPCWKHGERDISLQKMVWKQFFSRDGRRKILDIFFLTR